MWPFKKKKKEEGKASGLNRPVESKHNLPSLPRIDDKSKGFPSYDQELGEIKKAIDKPIPKYEGGISNIKKSIDNQLSAKGDPLNIPKRKSPFMKEHKPSLPIHREKKHEIKIEHHEGGSSKPIFVKLNNYKSAKDSLGKIKDLAKEAESLLSDLNQTREEEDKELDKWKADIEKIKNNLLSVDKKLFEL